MLQPDSQRQDFNIDNIIGNNDCINNEMISEIEKELRDDPYDMISLVFLLYNVPDTALQRLIVFQRVSKDIGTSTNLNMLHEWFLHAKHSPTWKHEFVEALLLCQLNNIVRKLGIPVSSARKYYKTDDIQMTKYINPAKKALYKLCENMNAEIFLKLKKALLSYDIDTAEYDTCEQVFLKLMCEKFITVNQFQYDQKTLGFHCRLDKLLRIIKNLEGLQKCAQEIHTLQMSINEDAGPSSPIAKTILTPIQVDESSQNATGGCLFNKDFEDTFDMISQLTLEENANLKSLKSDKNSLGNDTYEIKNTERIGVCVIINQMDFHPSKNSIENANQCNALTTRTGSELDTVVIHKTMSALNLKVYPAKNLNHKQIFQFLEEVIKVKVSEDDSVFMLCILSHGVRGHIFAADSVKVKMDDIQNFLDSDIAAKLHGKPKLLIVQACQVDEAPHRLVADSPENNYTLKKTNFLIYWATSPELEAYRDELKGSIFIQLLCRVLLKHVHTEHITDIFTKVTDLVCEKLGGAQVPIYHTTMRKKLYLKMPK